MTKRKVKFHLPNYPKPVLKNLRRCWQNWIERSYWITWFIGMSQSLRMHLYVYPYIYILINSIQYLSSEQVFNWIVQKTCSEFSVYVSEKVTIVRWFFSMIWFTATRFWKRLVIWVKCLSFLAKLNCRFFFLIIMSQSLRKHLYVYPYLYLDQFNLIFEFWTSFQLNCTENLFRVHCIYLLKGYYCQMIFSTIWLTATRL